MKSISEASERNAEQSKSDPRECKVLASLTMK